MFFTYSQMITGRMWAPQQDTPSNRITWGGCITTNNYLMPYMSANMTGSYTSIYGYEKTCFYNSVKAPNYLMAVVVGAFDQGEIVNFGGYDTYVLAEPNVLASALSEFSNLQQIVQTVELYV